MAFAATCPLTPIRRTAARRTRCTPDPAARTASATDPGSAGPAQGRRLLAAPTPASPARTGVSDAAIGLAVVIGAVHVLHLKAAVHAARARGNAAVLRTASIAGGTIVVSRAAREAARVATAVGSTGDRRVSDTQPVSVAARRRGHTGNARGAAAALLRSGIAACRAVHAVTGSPAFDAGTSARHS